MKKLITIEKMVNKLMHKHLSGDLRHKDVCDKLFHYNDRVHDKPTLGMFIPCDTDGKPLVKPVYNADKELEFQAKYNEYEKAEKRVLFKGFDDEEELGKILERDFSGDSNVQFNASTLHIYVDGGYEFNLTKSGKKHFQYKH